MRNLVASGARARALLLPFFSPSSPHPPFFFAAHPQPEWMLMDARAITSEPRDLTPSSRYGCNLFHLRSAFGLTPSKRLYRERSERPVPRLVSFFNRTIDTKHEKFMRVKQMGCVAAIFNENCFQHTSIIFADVFSFNRFNYLRYCYSRVLDSLQIGNSALPKY